MSEPPTVMKMGKDTDTEDIETFSAIARDCAVWWIQETFSPDVKWEPRDITVKRVEKFRKVVAEISGSLSVAVAPGKYCRLHFRIRTERQPQLDYIMYPPSGFKLDKRTDQVFWLGEKRVELKNPSKQSMVDAYTKHYA